MLTTIEAEIDVNGNVTLLEPIRLSKKNRAIVTLLEVDNVARKPLSEEEKRLAEERFTRWIGAWDSGDPNSADNERIDADLAREYGAGLDE
ncbi:MAG: hypothetical protein ACREBD_23025 [Blastocatellia bacterium]